MKTTIIITLFLLLSGASMLLVKHEINKDKQYIKLVRKGCCQFRINEFTDEVVHFESCDNLSHVE